MGVPEAMVNFCAPTLASVVTPSCKSRTKTSGMPFVSPVTKLLAALTKATYRPSGVMAASREGPLPGEPFVLTLTRVVTLLIISRTKTSPVPLVSPPTRSDAALSKAMNWPLVEMALGKESPLPPPVPAELTLTKKVVPACRSRT